MNSLRHRCLPFLVHRPAVTLEMRLITGSLSAVLSLMGGSSAFSTIPTRGVHSRAFRRSGYLAMVDVSLAQKGLADTIEYRVFFNKDGKEISPWHDIPLKVEMYA